MIKFLRKLVVILSSLYILMCAILYFFQEKILFFPQKIKKEYSYEFENNFEEIDIKTANGSVLNGLLFKAKKAKGLIFYLHGNAGSLLSWGHVAQTYLGLNYDVFIFDYRGFGKSEGKIFSEEQLFNDNQLFYNQMKKRYSEDQIIVLGYSIGTGMAAKIASTNSPKLLLLNAPYYNMTTMMKKRFPFVPTFLLRYKLETNCYLKKCQMPVVLFHGDTDEVIPLESSLNLKNECKKNDTLIILSNQSHNGITDNIDYKASLREILLKY